MTLLAISTSQSAETPPSCEPVSAGLPSLELIVTDAPHRAHRHVRTWSLLPRWCVPEG